MDVHRPSRARFGERRTSSWSGRLEHRRLRSELDAYVDGELGAERQRSVSEHLTRCAGCARAVRLTRRIKTSLTARVGTGR